jgi:hypothetical protein
MAIGKPFFKKDITIQILFGLHHNQSFDVITSMSTRKPMPFYFELIMFLAFYESSVLTFPKHLPSLLKPFSLLESC